jgi:hypothetical protein
MSAFDMFAGWQDLSSVHNLRVPVDKSEGVVKTHFHRAVAGRFLRPQV